MTSDPPGNRRRESLDLAAELERQRTEDLSVDASMTGWGTETEKALAAARDHAAVGLDLPPMSRQRRWRRSLARGIGKGVLRLAQVVTYGQRAYNRHLLEALGSMSERLRLQERRLTALERRLATETSLAEQEVDCLRSDHRSVAAALQDDLAPRLAALEENESPPLDEQSYRCFEDRFRGTREQVREWAVHYVELLRQHGAGTAERPIVDLGCGRGELLELLAEAGLRARGVDVGRRGVAACRVLGLDVEAADAVTWLEAQPPRSLGAVTAIHLLEHLPPRRVLPLVRLAFRALAPGGILLAECPNPENIVVGASSFYLDPTHRRPLHPLWLRFVLEISGFERLEKLDLHPIDQQAERSTHDPLSRFLLGPQDFAVIAFRPWHA